MSNIRLKHFILAVLVCAAFSAFSGSKQPVLTLTPLTNPLLEVPVGEMREVQYKLINHSDKSYTLNMKPIKNIVQQTDNRTFCQNPMLLKPGKSCLLSLYVDGRQIESLEKEGPLLCENAWNWFDEEALSSGVCVQPKPEHRLSIHSVPAATVTLSIAVKNGYATAEKKENLASKNCFASLTECTLVLFQGTDTQGRLVITNTSNIIARSIQASGLPAGVTQDASNCISLSPGQSCTLQFTPGNIKNSGVSIAVSGTNTATSYVTMQVLGIGDMYAGGQLFQLPTSANSYHYFIAASADASASPQNLNTTSTLCTNAGYILPQLPQLLLLYDASNCNSGPIGGFNCIVEPSYIYWSNTDGGVGKSCLNFSNETQLSQPISANASGRCVKEFITS